MRILFEHFVALLVFHSTVWYCFDYNFSASIATTSNAFTETWSKIGASIYWIHIFIAWIKYVIALCARVFMRKNCMWVLLEKQKTVAFKIYRPHILYVRCLCYGIPQKKKKNIENESNHFWPKWKRGSGY